MNRSGIYIAGISAAHGARPRGRSGAATGDRGAENAPGFGDLTEAHGPLGGGQTGLDWQTGQWVFGLQMDADSDDPGENTCFPRLGGVNCEHQINALATLTGRAGFAWGRSLFYVKGGGAFASTDYNINGNTGVLTLGNQISTVDTFGWTTGIGLEYALSDHWTTSFEYDHIGLGDVTVPFPAIATINTQRIGVTQSVDTLKLGVNYRFNWFETATASSVMR